jgi:hypothetical protein
MNKTQALEFLEYMRYILNSEHEWSYNYCQSTSESTYKKMEEKLAADLDQLDKLEEFIKTKVAND